MSSRTMTQVIVAHLEESGDRYDLRYSASIRRLADDITELMGNAGFGDVREAGAEALKWAADDFSVNLTAMSGPRIREWLRDQGGKP